jgi:hypothetical protein
MASGNTLLLANAGAADPLATTPAVMGQRNSQPTLDFDAAADRMALFSFPVMPANYSGGGITVVLRWVAATATSGNVKWNVEIEGDNGQDIDSDSFASAQTVTTACNGTSGIESTTSIPFTSGAQMDSVAAGDRFRMRITRDADDGADTMAGNAQLLGFYLKET